MIALELSLGARIREVSSTVAGRTATGSIAVFLSTVAEPVTKTKPWMASVGVKR